MLPNINCKQYNKDTGRCSKKAKILGLIKPLCEELTNGKCSIGKEEYPKPPPPPPPPPKRYITR